MKIKAEKSELYGSVELPASKSVAHRALILAALGGKYVEFLGKIEGNDISATVRCLAVLAKETLCAQKLENALKTLKNVALNANMNIDARYFDCGVPNEKSEDGYLELDADESGSTLRFLLPVACYFGVKARFVGRGRLAERPIEALIVALNKQGVDIGGSKLPITVNGKAEGNCISVDGGVSSQFITGLLLAFALTGGGIIKVLGKSVSKAYIDITINVLKTFGINVKSSADGYIVSGEIIAPKSFTVESDWSTAAIMLAAGALLGEVTVKGINVDSAQGDKVVLDILKRAGADIIIGKNNVKVTKAQLCALNFDASGCPDLVPVLCVVLAVANGKSEIYGVDRLQYKESDRLSAIIEMLKTAGIRTQYWTNTLAIYGGNLKCGDFKSFADHRIAMSAVICAMCANGVSTVDDITCTNKSYPDFLKDIILLGGKINAE